MIYGPFIFTLSDGREMQFDDYTLEQAKYHAALMFGLLGPRVVRVETVLEWQKRFMAEKLGGSPQ